MALTRLNAFATGTILTNAQQTGEFDNIYNNALTLISPLTGNLNCNTKQLTNLVLENAAVSKTAATAGIVYYQTTANLLEVDDGAIIRRAMLTNSATVSLNRIPVVAANNLHTYNANFTFDGTTFTVATGGPHALGGVANTRHQLALTGPFTGVGGGLNTTFNLDTTLTNTAAISMAGMQLGQNFTNVSGVTADVDWLLISPKALTITAGSVTNAAAIKIEGAPSGAGTNYALWIVSGGVRIGSLAAFAAGDKYVIVDANGNLHVSGLGPLS